MTDASSLAAAADEHGTVRGARHRLRRSLVWPGGHELATSRLAWHAAFWTVHVANELLISLVEQRPAMRILLLTVRTFVVLGAPGYAYIGLFGPRLSRRGHRVLGLLAFGALVIAAAFAQSTLRMGSGALTEPFLRQVARWTSTSLMYSCSVIGLDLAVMLLRAARARAETERRQAEQRLEHLRAQLHPHFLFNTLNSLYALAITKAPELPALILRQADLLRYSLEQAAQARVPLGDEVEFLSAYIELERVRLEATADVQFDVVGVLQGQEIAPMLFAPLVENCFKHLGPGRDGVPRIMVQLQIEGDHLVLRLRNTRARAGDVGLRPSTGIGLRNTRERLTLLYPGRHQLTVRTEDECFIAELRVVT